MQLIVTLKMQRENISTNYNSVSQMKKFDCLSVSIIIQICNPNINWLMIVQLPTNIKYGKIFWRYGEFQTVDIFMAEIMTEVWGKFWFMLIYEVYRH